jgi:hypothetical protein
MKNVLKVLLIMTIATPVFADEKLIQALLDLNVQLAKITKEFPSCYNDVANYKRKVVKPGVYKYEFDLVNLSMRETQGRYECNIVINQDVTPTYADGSIKYKVQVTKPVVDSGERN